MNPQPLAPLAHSSCVHTDRGAGLCLGLVARAFSLRRQVRVHAPHLRAWH